MSQGARSEGQGPADCFATFPVTSVIPLHVKIRAMLDAEPATPPLDTLPVAQLRALREGADPEPHRDLAGGLRYVPASLR